MCLANHGCFYKLQKYLVIFEDAKLPQGIFQFTASDCN